MAVLAYWESEGFVYKASGIVTVEEILKANDAFLEVPDGVVPKYQVVNALEIEEMWVNEVDLVNISADDLSASRKFPEMKVAMIAHEGPVMENFIKYLKVSWSINTSWDIRIFNSLNAARAWLGHFEP